MNKCKICGGQIEEDNYTSICYACQSIMSTDDDVMGQMF